MCIITRSKPNSEITTEKNTNNESGASNQSWTDFLVKFVVENGPGSIHGLHRRINEGSAKPTQLSMHVFFSSMGANSHLSYMQKLKCAMVVSDNLYRILYQLLDNRKWKKTTTLDNTPLQKIASEFDSSRQEEKMDRLCRVKMPFAFVFEDQDRDVVETIGRMYNEIKLQLEKDGGTADTWDVFRRKIRSARQIVEVFVANERLKLNESTRKRTPNFGNTFVPRWNKLETHLETVLNSKHSPEHIKRKVMKYYSEGGVDQADPQKRKRMASESTLAMHAKPVEASAEVQPTAPKKRRKQHLLGKNQNEADVEKKKTDRNFVRKTDVAALFKGETKPYKPERCQAVIVIETFRRGPAMVKGITLEKEKSYGPGDFNYVAGEKHNKKLSSVLLCDTTSAYLYAFKRADLKPHFVLPTEKAAEYIRTIVNGKNMEQLA